MKKKILVITMLSIFSAISFAELTETSEPVVIEKKEVVLTPISEEEKAAILFIEKIKSENAKEYLNSLKDEDLKKQIIYFLAQTEQLKYNKDKSSIEINDIILKDIQVLGFLEKPILIDSIEFSVNDMRKLILNEIGIEKLKLTVNGIQIKIPAPFQATFQLPEIITGDFKGVMEKEDNGDLSQMFNFDIKDMIRISYGGKLIDSNILWKNLLIEQEESDKFYKVQEKNKTNLEFKGHHPFVKSFIENGEIENPESFFGKAKIDSYSFEFVNKGLLETVEKLYPPLMMMKQQGKISSKKLEKSNLSEENKKELVKFLSDPQSISIKSAFEEKVLISSIFDLIIQIKNKEKELIKKKTPPITELSSEESEKLKKEFLEVLMKMMKTNFSANTLKE